jgi:hypothetical protein
VIIRKLEDEYVAESKHFSQKELYDAAPFAPSTKLIYGPTLELAEAIRKEWGRPLRVNAGVRTKAKQADLKRRGYKAATYSPHVYRCALDIDTTSRDETERLVRVIRKVSRETGIPCRIGWQSYLRSGMTFIHVDVAPMIAAAALEAGAIPRWVYKAWSQAGLEW